METSFGKAAAGFKFSKPRSILGLAIPPMDLGKSKYHEQDVSDVAQHNTPEQETISTNDPTQC